MARSRRDITLMLAVLEELEVHGTYLRAILKVTDLIHHGVQLFSYREMIFWEICRTVNHVDYCPYCSFLRQIIERGLPHDLSFAGFTLCGPSPATHLGVISPSL